MKNNRIYLLAGILAVLILVAYLITSNKGEKTTTDDLEMTKFFEVDSAAVDKLEFVQNGKKFVISKVAGVWRLTEPVDYPVMNDFVGMALSDLKNYKLESKVSNNPSKKTSFGFVDSAQVTLTVYENGAPKGTFVIGGSAQGPSQTYVKLADKDQVYLADGFLRNNFAKTNVDEWRDKAIVSIPAEMVKSIEFSGAETFRLAKDSTGKFAIDGTPADSTQVTGMLNLLQNFNTQNFKDTVLGPETKFDRTIKIDWGNTTELMFLKRGDSTNVNYLLKVSDKKQIFEFNEGLANNILKQRKDFIKKD